MYEKMKRSIQYALIGALFLGPLAGVANAQEGEDAPGKTSTTCCSHFI